MRRRPSSLLLRFCPLLVLPLVLASCVGPPRVLEGNLTHAGRPMSAYTSQQPTFWFRDEISNQVATGISTWYDPVSSRYRLGNLPATSLGISVTFPVTGGNWTLPGNFNAWRTVDLTRLDDRSEYDLPLEKIMHLLRPIDNAAIQPATDGYPSYPAPLPVQWQALDEASFYQVTVQECRDPGNPAYVQGCDRCTTVTSVQTQYPNLALALPASADLTHFEVALLAADKAGNPFGKLMVTHQNGYGWDFRFRIVDRSPSGSN